MNYFNYNGKIYQQGSPVITVDSRGLRYGDGLFETMKMKKGSLLFEDEHFSRLWKGMKILEFDLPRHFTADRLQREIKFLAEKNHHAPAARIRLTILRGEGGLYDVPNHIPVYIIQTWPLAENHDQWNSNGLVLGIYDAVRKGCDILSNLKHNNYLPNVLAAQTAKKEKWNDAILLNSYGKFCETTIANIFLIKDELVYTPSLTGGCVSGVMRRAIIKSLSHTPQTVIEKDLDTNDLIIADEVFLTNSMYNIRWVQRIGEIVYRNDITSKIFASVIQTIS